MGHIRTGRFPKTRRWQELIGLLQSSPDDIEQIASQTVSAAERRLRQLADDPSLGYALWFLTRVAWASRGASFIGQLNEFGISLAADDPAVSFIAQSSDHIRETFSQLPQSGPFGELASLALRRALAETVGQQSVGLFGASVADLQQAMREYSTSSGFSVLARRFFADFMARTIRFYVDREVANVVGVLQGTDATRRFDEALDIYTRQSARVLDSFAADWCSKRNWLTGGEVSREEAQAFVAVALRKLRSELEPAYR